MTNPFRHLINLVDSVELDGQAEFIFESPSDEIIATLNSTKFTDTIRKTGTTVSVLVPIADRRNAIDELLDILPGAVYDPNISGSSFGGIKYNGGKILVKPSGKQGAQSAGVGNELEVFAVIDEMVQTYGKITVTFKSNTGKSFTVNDVQGIEHSGKETTGRLKGDIRLVISDKKHPISIKKLRAEVWESADSYFGPTAAKLLKKLYDEKKIALTGLGKFNPAGQEYVRISPEVIVEPTPEEIRDVVFGEDIESMDGAVVFQTFAPQHFTRDDDKLVIECESVIRSISEIPRSHLMVWLIRNDSTRNPKGGIPGLRITAAVQTRAFGKNGTKTDILYVTRTGKELENPMADIAERYRAAKGQKQAAQLAKISAANKIDAIASGRSMTDIRPPGAPKEKRDRVVSAPRSRR